MSEDEKQELERYLNGTYEKINMEYLENKHIEDNNKDTVDIDKNIPPNSLIINCTSFGAIENLNVLSEKILENVRTKFISQQIQKDLEEDKLEKKDSQQKIENFSAILNSINI